jgi:hypothetical protein
VRRFSGRLKKLEVVARRCPGDGERLRLFRATKEGAERLPPIEPCRRCKKFHAHPDGKPVIRRVVIIIPEGVAEKMPAEGYREVEGWRGGRSPSWRPNVARDDEPALATNRQGRKG